MATKSKDKATPQLSRRGLATARLPGAKPTDQRIMVSGRGRNLAVGKSLPKAWAFVRVTKTSHKDGSISLHIRPLTLVEGE